MTRLESRGILVHIVTLVALISGSFLTIRQPDSWRGLVLLVIGFYGCWLCYKRWKIATEATPEQKEQIERQDKESRTKLGMWLLILFVVAAFLEIIALVTGLILNANMGGELGYTIIRYAVYIGGVIAAVFLGFLMFFA